MLKEFKEFALRGNLLDLAIGFIIGAAFTGLVQSLVNDIIMPIIGVITGGFDFSNLYVQLAGTSAPTLADARKAGATLAYGTFITLVINFLIVAFVIFLLVKQINRFKREHAPATVTQDTPETKDCPFCRSTVALKATRCPNCTSDLSALPA